MSSLLLMERMPQEICEHMQLIHGPFLQWQSLPHMLSENTKYSFTHARACVFSDGCAVTLQIVGMAIASARASARFRQHIYRHKS